MVTLVFLLLPIPLGKQTTKEWKRSRLEDYIYIFKKFLHTDQRCAGKKKLRLVLSRSIQVNCDSFKVQYHGIVVVATLIGFVTWTAMWHYQKLPYFFLCKLSASRILSSVKEATQKVLNELTTDGYALIFQFRKTSAHLVTVGFNTNANFVYFRLWCFSIY